MARCTLTLVNRDRQFSIIFNFFLNPEFDSNAVDIALSKFEGACNFGICFFGHVLLFEGDLKHKKVGQP